MRWSGWSDSPSDIKEYRLVLYKMKFYGDALGYRDIKPIVNYRGTQKQTSVSLTKADAG